MAHGDELLPPGEQASSDEWAEHLLRKRTLQPGDGRETPDLPLTQELQQFYQEEAQAVDRRLERVWQRLEQRTATPQSQRETLPQVLPIFPHERRYRSMRNPLSAFHAPQRWSARIGALVAAVLLVALVGGLAFGLVLVRHNGPNPQTAHGSTATPTASPTPAPTNSPAGGHAFAGIDMMTANEGWATAYSTPSISGEPTQILHTTNGGVHWKNVTPQPPAALAQSGAAFSPLSDGAAPRTEDFLSASAAWVLQFPDHLFKTTDGGATWQAAALPGDSLRQFTFLDAQHGWVITEANGTVGTFRTTDGGAHWTRMQSSANAFPLQTRFWGVRFLNLTTGWAAFINNSAGATAAVYKTTDSGATWHLQQIAMPAGVIPPVFLNAPVFFNDQDGMMEVMFGGINGQLHRQIANLPASGGAPEALYITRDGGAIWQGPIILQGLEFPHFINVLHGWALNSTGSGLLTTSDSGQHWATISTSANFSEMSFPDFVSGQIGWALKYDDSAGNYSLLLKTEDGGQTWTQLNISISR